MNILIIGSGAREHAITKALACSPRQVQLFCLGTQINPGIKTLTTDYLVDDITDPNIAARLAKQWRIDMAIIGPEAPLAAGVADQLQADAIATIGPKKVLAQIETSKQFARDLLEKYNIPASPAYRAFNTLDGIKAYLELWSQQYVIKADGLMGGKGVKVFGDHLHSDQQAYDYCKSLIDNKQSLVIEEKLVGPEFSLISFCDGHNLAHTPAIQDHKRAFVNDDGPNTGGMGSYSDRDHCLPFLSQQDIEQAQAFNEATIKALYQETGEAYVGFLYGGFMATAQGVKLIEYNARLGDPEAINLLGLLDCDFVSVCQAMVAGKLKQTPISFADQASVCKYLVPNGYPEQAVKNQLIDISLVKDIDSLYYAAIDERDGKLYQTGSRAIAVLTVADTISQAEQQAEKIVADIKGPLFHRADIGTATLINKRIELINTIRKTNYKRL
ncbi:MAG: phosphoribosylamine--glycine ligase [Pseudomonadota bacterium]